MLNAPFLGPRLSPDKDTITDLNNSQKKNHELAQSLHAKSKQQAHTQELYDKLKRRDQMSQVQNAASDAVDQTIQGSATVNGYSDHFRKANDPPFRSPVFPSLQGNSMGPPPVPTSMPLPGVAGRTGLGNGWIGLAGQGNNNQGIFSPPLYSNCNADYLYRSCRCTDTFEPKTET
jgi:E3 ubiquitin-protein ligase CCNP1IP1